MLDDVNEDFSLMRKQRRDMSDTPEIDASWSDGEKREREPMTIKEFLLR